MSLFSLIVELLLAVARLLSPAAGSAVQERAAGAASQRVEDMSREERRISAAARAGLDAGQLPDNPDPYDRDSTP